MSVIYCRHPSVLLELQSQLLGAFRESSEISLEHKRMYKFLTLHQVDSVVDLSMKSLGIVISQKKDAIFNINNQIT